MRFRSLATQFGRLLLFSMVALFVVTPHAARAFDTGYHEDLCYAALSDLDFSPDAIRVVQVQNWLTDYYSASGANSPSVEDFEKLHCDCLFSNGAVINYWNRLATNTKSAVQDAARANDGLKFLTLLGVSLHTVQDFYTHSNWAELYPKRTEDRFVVRTVFSTPITDQVQVYTGWYKNKLYPKQPAGTHAHGDYTSGMNHDSYNRPNWDQAYVHAYAASYEWARNCIDWAKQANPNFNVSRLISLSDKEKKELDIDMAAAYRISETIHTGSHNGHWKGQGTGHAVFFLNYTPMWMAMPNSIFVQCFKKKGYEKLLTPGLYDSNPSTSVQTPAITVWAPPRQYVLFFKTTEAKSKRGNVLVVTHITENANSGYKYIDACGQLKDGKITANWTAPYFYRANGKFDITYDLYDENFSTLNHLNPYIFTEYAPCTGDTHYTINPEKHSGASKTFRIGVDGGAHVIKLDGKSYTITSGFEFKVAGPGDKSDPAEAKLKFMFYGMEYSASPGVTVTHSQ